MSDDLVSAARRHQGPPFMLVDGALKETSHVLADALESQAAEITRLRAELAAARREGMEQAARENDCAMRELFGCADEYKQGWNDGLEAGAAAIRAAVGEVKP